MILHHRKNQSEFFSIYFLLFTLIYNKSCESLFIRHCRIWLRYYVNPWFTTSRSTKESLVIISRTNVRTFVWTVHSRTVELLCKPLNNIVLTSLLFLFITLFFYLLFFFFVLFIVCLFFVLLSVCCLCCVYCCTNKREQLFDCSLDVLFLLCFSFLKCLIHSF